MAGQLRATSEFGRRAPRGFLTPWTGPGPYNCPGPYRELHCAPNDAGSPKPKRRREGPGWGDEAWGVMQPDLASWCWEAGIASLGPPDLAAGRPRGRPAGPPGPGLRVSSVMGSAPVLWTPACQRKPLEWAYQSSLEKRQEPRGSLKQKEEKEIHSIVHVDTKKTPGNFLMEKEAWFFLSEEEETASLGFLEVEERELVTKKERDWSSQQKLREDYMSLHFPSIPRKEDEVLSAYPKLDCFPKNEAESKSIDMDVQENHTKKHSPFALASPVNSARMKRIIKTWPHWCGIPFEADMVMGALSMYPENPPWPASVEFLDNPHTSPLDLYGNQSMLKKNKWPHFISGPKTSGHLHPRCCQGA
ncbi:uncharacterized protein LOC118850390 [Trichosurus vulpecula]|uniref:uncharacterized protein LOC118850390 n=1 Tax=Trichosurus vulpecula TaxID=9337 RepID=UPI00186B0A59|nr:uncharacterized protein LOC118850390 [Trichosurus vulpecula]